MKCLLLALTLSIAVSAYTDEEISTSKPEVFQYQHWAKRLRQITKDPTIDDRGRSYLTLSAILKISRNENPYKKLEHRFTYNPLNYTDIDTRVKIEKWRTGLMAMRYQRKGAQALWNKFKAQERSDVESQAFTDVVELALEGVAQFIEEYQQSLKEACGNVKSFLTGEMDAPRTQKLDEMRAIQIKTKVCTKRLMELLDITYANEDANPMDDNDIVLSTLVHNATRISRRYTDCAASIAMMAILTKNESYLDKLYETYDKWVKDVFIIHYSNNEFLDVISSRTFRGERLDKTYKQLVEDYNTPPIKDVISSGMISDLIGEFHPKTGTAVGKDVIRSVTQAAVELDLQHDGDCLKYISKLSIQLNV